MLVVLRIAYCELQCLRTLDPEDISSAEAILQSYAGDQRSQRGAHCSLKFIWSRVGWYSRPMLGRAFEPKGMSKDRAHIEASNTYEAGMN